MCARSVTTGTIKQIPMRVSLDCKNIRICDSNLTRINKRGSFLTCSLMLMSVDLLEQR